MEDKIILKSIADTFTEAPVFQMRVPVRVVQPIQPIKRTWIDRLLRKPIPISPDPETYRDFVIYPCVAANMIRIAGQAALLSEAIYEDNSENLVKLVPEEMPFMIYIIAAAIQNNHLEPDPELIEFIKINMSGRQIKEALFASFDALEMEAFTDSIVLLKGRVKIINPETSPEDGSELIASHTALSDQHAVTSGGVNGM
jgi:hypothetical protein